MSKPNLTAAEQAAANAIHLEAVLNGDVDADYLVEHFNGYAKAAVKAVRPIHAKGHLIELAGILDDYTYTDAAALLRCMADSPTPGDAHYVEEASR